MYQNLIMVLIPFIAGGIVWLLERARIRVEKRQIEEILRILYEIIFEVEKSGLSGTDKKVKALALAENRLSENQKEILRKNKGGIAGAMQLVFERYGQPVIESRKIARLLQKIIKNEKLTTDNSENS